MPILSFQTARSVRTVLTGPSARSGHPVLTGLIGSLIPDTLPVGREYSATSAEFYRRCCQNSTKPHQGIVPLCRETKHPTESLDQVVSLVRGTLLKLGSLRTPGTLRINGSLCNSGTLTSIGSLIRFGTLAVDDSLALSDTLVIDGINIYSAAIIARPP